MDLAKDMNNGRLAMMSAVWGIILITSFLRGNSDDVIHIMDLKEDACRAIFIAFVVLTLLTAALYYINFKAAWVVSAVVGVILMPFGLCLLLNLVDNYTGYFGWVATVAGLGCLYTAYLGWNVANREN